MAMRNKINDPIARLMGLRYKSHPWHGIEIGENAPDMCTAFIEMVPTDTVKYEVDKVSGFLKIDRPQKYSNVIPALYGFLPQTFCGKEVGAYSAEKSGKEEVRGDGDPLDICILTEKTISHGDLLANVKPIGGFRMIDGNEADDKIIAVLLGDATYGNYDDVLDCPEIIIGRLKHYFLTYKDMPGLPANAEITHVYGRDEAHHVISLSIEDYKNRFENLNEILSHV